MLELGGGVVGLGAGAEVDDVAVGDRGEHVGHLEALAVRGGAAQAEEEVAALRGGVRGAGTGSRAAGAGTRPGEVMAGGGCCVLFGASRSIWPESVETRGRVK